jgi:hypothetical protein
MLSIQLIKLYRAQSQVKVKLSHNRPWKPIGS